MQINQLTCVSERAGPIISFRTFEVIGIIEDFSPLNRYEATVSKFDNCTVDSTCSKIRDFVVSICKPQYR